MENTGKVLGVQEKVRFPAFHAEVEAKIDTGATTSSLHATNVSAHGNAVTFKSELLSPNTIKLDSHGSQEVHSADFGGDERPIVKMDIEIGGQLLKGVTFNLNDRSNMDSKVLIGQDVLKAGGFQVDVSRNAEATPDEAGVTEPQVQREAVEQKNANIAELVRLLTETDITVAELVRYLQTEAVNRIKD